MGAYKRALLCCATVGSLLLSAWGAAATELGDFCWQTDAGDLLRFSVSQEGPTRYTYTGIFVEPDGVAFAVIGHVGLSGDTLVGSFSGAKTTSSDFKTAIFRVTFDPGTLVGSGEGIRQKYDRMTTGVSTDYRTRTLTPAPCP